MASYSHTVHTAATDTYTFEVGFSYVRSGDVKVYVDGKLNTDWDFSDAGTTITWDDGDEPQTGESFVIKRVTDISDAAVTFTNGSGVTHGDLNTALLQLLYSLDELQVPFYEYNETMTTVVTGGDITDDTGFGTTVPTRVQVWMQCLDSDLGYILKDWVEVGASTANLLLRWYAHNTGFLIINDVLATAFTLPHKDTGVATAITDSKWRLHVKAWK